MSKSPLNLPLYYFRRECGTVFPAQTVADLIKAQNLVEFEVPRIMACRVGTTQWIPLAALCLPPAPEPAPKLIPSNPPDPICLPRVLLWLLLVTSLFLGLLTLSMDTTVKTPGGPVHNLAKAHHQLLYAIFCAGGFLAGLLGLCFHRSSKTDATGPIISASLQSVPPMPPPVTTR